MSSPEFTHLHCHTEYSLLDGLSRIEPLMDAAVKQGMTSLALTDHGVMYGAIEFYKAAKERGIKPILGCEVYVSPRGMEQREGRQDAANYHFVLLAENETGYRNLLTLASEAQLRGYYYKPRVDKELLARHSEGLIALSACLSSEVARHLVRQELDAAEKAARWYAEVFEGRFYLELQDHGLAEQHTVNGHIAAMARRLGLPLVVTNDVHYIAREHAWAQEVLLCIQTNTTVEDPKRMKMDSQEFYLKSAREMWDRFGQYPEALKNTLAIAERCNLTLEFGRVQLPEMPVPEGHTVDTHLAAVCHARLAERYAEVTPQMRERLDYELAVIRKTGFAAYFLLLDDIIGYARRQGIMIGPGRGSAVGSLVSYCLGITNVDPLPLDLLFERFLNPDRLSMPDIDTDFADDRRDEVIRYITQRFGADRVAQISTFGTMAARAAIKDVGRALGIPYGEVERVAKLIPPKANLQAALEVPELREMYEHTDYVKRLVDTARQLEDVKRHNSTHAAGVVISRDPLVNVSPLVRVGKEGAEGQATQYEATILEKVGLLKMDILGLTTLTLIQRTIANVEKSRGHLVEPDEIPLDDPCIYDLLTSGETAGIFQLESPPMRKILRDMKPDRFTDIVAVVALYRPGPMNYIDQYIARKNGSEPITYLHDDLRPILEDTYGVCVSGDTLIMDARTGQRHRIDAISPDMGLVVQGVDADWAPALGRVTHWLYSGRKPVYSLTLRNGATIKATADHRFLTELGWRSLSDLAVGDYVATPTALVTEQRPSAEEREIDQAIILAYLLADGCLSTSQPSFYSKDRALVDDFIARCESAFGPLSFFRAEGKRGVQHVGVSKSAHRRRGGAYVHEPSSLDVWLRSFGLRWKDGDERAAGTQRKGMTSAGKYVPEWVFGLPDDAIARFLAALWDCDGYVGRKCAHYKTISRRLASDVQTLLLRVGVRSTIYRSSYTLADERPTSAFQVTVFDTGRFADTIQRHMLTRKATVVYRGVAQNMLDRRLVFTELRRATTLSGHGIEREYGFSRQALRYDADRIGAPTVACLVDKLDMPETARRCRVAWEEIVSIAYAGDEDVYDITVEGIHSFVGNNIIVHNCVYQDQVLRIALECAGMTWGDVDKLRKAMGKKIESEMLKQKDAFFAGFAKTTKWIYQQDEDGVPTAVEAPKPAYPKELADVLWDRIVTFSGYGFNKAHASAYAQLACQTAYLKARYPVEYMAACLSIETGHPDRMAVVLGECRRLGIPILPPDVNHSEMDFTVEGDGGRDGGRDGVRYALQAVKNVGASAIRSIVAAREQDGPFRDLDDFCRRVEWKSLNKRALESLIKAGAMDALGHRAVLLGNLDRICSHAQRAERAAEAGQVSLFAAVEDTVALSLPSLQLAPAPELDQKKLLLWEKEMLGLYVSEHPLAAYLERGRHLGAVPISTLSPALAGRRVKVGAQVVSLRQILTKKQETMVVLELEDLEQTIEAVVFPRTYSRFRELCTEEAILLVDGTVDVRNDRLQLIVEEMAVFEHKVSTGAGMLSVYVRRTGDRERDLARVQQTYLLLREFPGPDHVTLLTDAAGRRVPIPLPYDDDTVCCSPELLERLRDLLGPDAVEVTTPAPREEAPVSVSAATMAVVPDTSFTALDDPFAAVGDSDLEAEFVEVG